MSAPGRGPEPTSGMETGSDAGAPGDHLPDVPLTSSDRATLSDLLAAEDADTSTRAAGPAAREDDSDVVEAAEDDSPLPLPADEGDTGVPTGGDRTEDAGSADDVVFRAPDDENRG